MCYYFTVPGCVSYVGIGTCVVSSPVTGRVYFSVGKGRSWNWTARPGYTWFGLSAVAETSIVISASLAGLDVGRACVR